MEPLLGEGGREALVGRSDGAGDDLGSDEGGEEGVLGEEVVAQDLWMRCSNCEWPGQLSNTYPEPSAKLGGSGRGARKSEKGTKEKRRTDGSLLLTVEDRPELAKATHSEEGRELAEEGKDQGELRVVLVVVVRDGDRELFVVHVQKRVKGFEKGEVKRGQDCGGQRGSGKKETDSSVTSDGHGESKVGCGSSDECLEQELNKHVRVEQRGVELVAGLSAQRMETCQPFFVQDQAARYTGRR